MMSGGEALIVEGDAKEILEKLAGADGFCELESQEGPVHVNPGSVGYVKDGEVADPLRDTPGPAV